LKIVDVKIYPVSIPLTETFRIAYGETSVAHTILIKIVTDEGIYGLGEASPTAKITGETLSQAVVNLEYLTSLLINEDPLNIGALEEKINRSLIGNTSVKAAISMALHDILGKVAKTPLYKLFGAYRRTFETDITIGIKDLKSTMKEAIKYVEQGFKTLKVKVGANPKEDIERVKAIRDAIGYNVKLRLDANQGWSKKEAVRVLKAMERYEIELIEQPVPYWDVEGLRYVKDNIDIPVIADESVHNSKDAIALIKRGAVDGFNIKLMKCGSLREALKIASIAEAEGLKCMIGCMVETKLALTAASHIVASTNNIVYIDLDGDLSMADQPVINGIQRDGGKIIVPEGYGLGVDIDEEKIKGFLVDREKCLKLGI